MGVLSGGTVVAAVALSGAVQAQAATIYVSPYPVGNDSTGTGGSAAPYASITRAVAAVGTTQGDTIQVNAGTYTDTVQLNRITNLKIIANGVVSLHSAAGNTDSIVRIQGCSTITFSGFDVSGLDTSGNLVAGVNCSGITLGPRYGDGQTARACYDIHIVNNVVHDIPGGGIGSVTGGKTNNYNWGSDYVYYVGNTVYHALSNNTYNSSAMGLLVCKSADNGGGYHNVIQQNRIRDNYNYTANSGGNNYHTDGNGIIIDSATTAGPRTIIQDNLVYDNSGRGIYVFNSSNVDVINNTTYKNCIDTTLDSSNDLSVGEIVVSTRSSPYDPNSPNNDMNVKVLDNICVAGPVTLPNGGGTFNPYTYVAINSDSTNATHTFASSVVVSDYNSYAGGHLNLVSINSFPTTLPYISPIFYNADVGDFREYNSSGAKSATINAGTNSGCSLYDFNDNPRPYTGDGVGIADLGAIEYGYP